MQEVNYKDFVKNIWQNLKNRKPLNGRIELSYHCNLNCIHCYCKGTERKGEELTTQQWRVIFDQLYEEGCLWLTFTGGEPFLRDDFLELYDYTYRKGFLINVFTNGTIMPFKVFELFKNKPPVSIEISLYGVTKEVYESVTQEPDSFERIWENIDKLLQIKIPLILKTPGLKQNKNEILKIKALTEELLGKKKFKFDSFIFPKIDGNTMPCQYRLSPEEILEIESSDPDMITQRREQLHQPINFKRPKEYLYQCDVCRERFFINPYGELQFCYLSQKYTFSLKDKSFKDGFYNELPKLLNKKFSTDSKCKTCSLRSFCLICPARAYLETGDEEAPVEYYCQLAKARQQ